MSIVVLYAVSNKLNHAENGFIRLFPPHVTTPKKIMDIQYNSWYISGATATKIYLSNYTTPDRLFETDFFLHDSMSHRLNILLGNKRLATSTRMIVDSPFIHIMDGNTPAFFKGRLDNLIMQYDSALAYFTLAIPISASSHILRSVGGKLHQNMLLKQLQHTLLVKENILQKQIDGIFCTDGALNYDAASNRLVYVYSYRNQFICMDTNLTVLYRSKTIDTVNSAKLSVDTVRSEGRVTLSSPPLFVNQQISTANGCLFVHSNLRANNENEEAFNLRSVIDVYRLQDGQYLFSFYLPDYRKKKIRDFKVVGNRLFALYDHYLYAYQLNFPNTYSR